MHACTSSMEVRDLSVKPISARHLAQAVREGKPKWWGALGCLVLVTYGFVPTAQPVSVFGRIYAGLHALARCACPVYP